MRALRITLIVLLVLGGLLIGADRLGAKLTEDKIADEIKSSQNARDVSVSIHGFPFLTQVAVKKLNSVDVELTGVTADNGERSIRVSEFDIHAKDVRLSDNFSTAVADRATGTARLSYPDLSDAADEGVRVSYGGKTQAGKGKVKVTVGVELFGRTLEHSTTSTVSVEKGDTIRLRADVIPGAEIPGLEDLVRDKIDYTRKIEGLPEGVRLEGIEPTRDGVNVRFSGTNVKVTS
ncbi:DUF2993 domain-containing protein [Streptomyces gobiensis]|uniref:LmeA family phospholipid-binding protein n=1 Tax=Streptomyces gobiensis TaxID=2875706 RepID=UPI001E446938|nr:DUF2993 domain-containing protein [Streptomyces gobiensis]UGY92164.1 DUF2993 domain-containing protein [Streptomyces gobiensis]